MQWRVGCAGWTGRHAAQLFLVSSILQRSSVCYYLVFLGMQHVLLRDHRASKWCARWAAPTLKPRVARPSENAPGSVVSRIPKPRER